MGTIAQEITRIQGAKSDLATSIANKGVTVPAATKIDGYAALVDQIQQGGGTENKFMQSTILDYMFYGRDLTDEKNFDGLKRFSQNNVTSLAYAFKSSKYTTFTDYDEVLDYLKKILTNAQLTSIANVFDYFDIPNTNTTPQDIKIFDLSNLNLAGSATHAFSEFARQSNNRYLKIKFKKTTFSNCTDVSYLFNRLPSGITLILEDNEIDFSSATDLQYAFFYIKGNIDNFNGISSKIINIKCNQNNTYNMSYIFSNSLIERVNFDNTKKCTTFTYAFETCSQLKSITGLNFESVTGTNISPFNIYSNLSNFGEFGIINGSTLGTVNNANLNLRKIWNATASTIRDGQTIGYWYEKFANALGNKAASGTQTITINTTLYNSLTQTQKELITNKGYTLAYAS